MSRNSIKFRKIILPLSEQKSSIKASTGKGLPQFKIAKRNASVDYKFWDDPNELVDRLRLLVAERSAGNTGHNNEILAIIEELREAEYTRWVTTISESKNPE